LPPRTLSPELSESLLPLSDFALLDSESKLPLDEGPSSSLSLLLLLASDALPLPCAPESNF
jgi:hypothetical protein